MTPAESSALLAALQSGLDVLALQANDAQRQRLLDYVELFHRWSRVHNLTSVRDPPAVVSHHLLDCLAVVLPLERHLGRGNQRLLDVGSGAGLPGTMLAIMRPDWEVTCVDSVLKKISFIRQVAAELRLPNLHAQHARVQDLSLPGFDAVISRAFASLRDFTSMTRRHIGPSGCWLAMKGRSPEQEIASLPADVIVFHVEPLQIPGLVGQRCLVWMRPQTPSPHSPQSLSKRPAHPP